MYTLTFDDGTTRDVGPDEWTRLVAQVREQSADAEHEHAIGCEHDFPVDITYVWSVLTPKLGVPWAGRRIMHLWGRMTSLHAHLFEVRCTACGGAVSGEYHYGHAPGALHLSAVDILRHAPAVRCPVADPVPAVDARGTVWVAPDVAVDVRYLTRTPSGRLRQPVVLGARTDAGVDPWESR